MPEIKMTCNRRVQEEFHLQEAAIETTGAGDTFLGSCLHFVLQYGLDNLTESRLAEMLRFANAAASVIAIRKGALRVIPQRAEVEALATCPVKKY